MKFYEINSNPLKEVKQLDLIPGKSYIRETGVKFKYQIDGSQLKEQCSPLNDSEVVSDLTPKLLTLFWKLLKNVKVYDASITGE